MARTWTSEDLMAAVRAFQPACVLVAAAELDVFSRLRGRALTAAELATKIRGDLRATTILLDSLAGLGVLTKSGDRYELPAEHAEVLADGGSQCMLGMIRHQGNCLRRWSRLADTVRSGKRPSLEPSILGDRGDLESFIRAMHEISTPMAGPLVDGLGEINFTHLLDIGGASGTWTIAFLRRHPQAVATIFDQAEVIPMAERLMHDAGLASRVRLAAGDFYTDPLPAGADLAWISAIIHQNSPRENRDLYAKAMAALVPGGQVLIRDIVMDESHTQPASGALFAVNMLVGTEHGGTYSFAEVAADLQSAGFADVRLVRQGEAMDSVIAAVKGR